MKLAGARAAAFCARPDAAMIGRRRSESEDVLLGVLVELDAAQSELTESSERLERTETQWTEDQERIAEERTVLEGEVAVLDEKRAAQAATTTSASSGSR